MTHCGGSLGGDRWIRKESNRLTVSHYYDIAVLSRVVAESRTKVASSATFEISTFECRRNCRAEKK